MVECWNVVSGTKGMIEVSNLGNMRSNLRKQGSPLKSCADKKGYRRLRVTIEREKLSFKVHREVAKAFIPNPNNLPQVNHIDGNKSNNAASNLEWVTGLQNANHAIKNGLWRNNLVGIIENNNSRKRKIIATNIASNEKQLFDSMSDAERALKTRHINAVIKGERKQANGFVFAYA